MSGHIIAIPLDMISTLIDCVGIHGGLMLAHHTRSATLIEKVRRKIFQFKYGEFTLSEMKSPLLEVINRIRFSVITIPKGIALRIEKDLLKIIFAGEKLPAEISLEESAQIYLKTLSILTQLRDNLVDFPLQRTLKDQRNIKRRRAGISALYQRYQILFQNTADHYKNFPRIIQTLTLFETPSVCLGHSGEFTIWGSHMFSLYNFSLELAGVKKCSFTLKYIAELELTCNFAEILNIQYCHLVMLKVVTAIFYREPHTNLVIHHPIYMLPLLYEANLLPVNTNYESILQMSRKKGQHLYEHLRVASQPNSKNIISIADKKIDQGRVSIRRLEMLKEVVFNQEGPILP